MSTTATRDLLATIFGRLFENEFATLDGIAISCRTPEGMDYVEGTAALASWLDDRVSAAPPPDPAVRELHAACYEAAPSHEVVISGWSRHLRALLLEGYPPPPATSMMRNRGVPDLAAHLVEPAALTNTALPRTLALAQELAAAGAMRHHLLITTEGYVVVSGAPPFEAMAHWHNVELAARVECLRLEDAALGRED
jgi:hypothetical protein